MSATWTLMQGNALEQLEAISDGTVQTCITSPPYYGLRDYGTGEWTGGDIDCDHVKGEMRRGVNLAQSVATTRGGAKKAAQVENIAYGKTCGKCGAERVDEQIGLEDTPEEYVEALVEVFRVLRRVLRDDGTLWLNLGDSYAGGGGGNYTKEPIHADHGQHPTNVRNRPGWLGAAGVKAKDLLGIPWMVAFALRADGWYLRSEIIWAKPNPMPESVLDRPTKAHEQVFLFAKSPVYYYDADAIREPAASSTDARLRRAGKGSGAQVDLSRNDRAGDMAKPTHPAGANKRTVWEVSAAPYPEAHFATYPPKLVEPMVLAGSAPRACGHCGAPWRRVTEHQAGHDGPRYGERAVGWEATCGHLDGAAYSVVLDPFAGSGTTLQVAVDRGRDAIGIELNPDSISLCRKRLQGVTAPLPGFAI